MLPVLVIVIVRQLPIVAYPESAISETLGVKVVVVGVDEDEELEVELLLELELLLIAATPVSMECSLQAMAKKSVKAVNTFCIFLDYQLRNTWLKSKFR